MNQMIIQSSAIDQDVIKEDDDEVTEIWPKNSIHCRLERGRSIAQAKWYHPELVVAMVRVKSRFADIIHMHQNLMITLKKVEFREPTCTSQFIKKFVYHWYRKMVLDSYCIECVIIYTESLGSIMLSYQENRRGEWAGARTI